MSQKKSFQRILSTFSHLSYLFVLAVSVYLFA